MRSDKKNLIVDKTFEFALKIVNFTDDLADERRFHLSNQLFKSGTSIGANVREAQNAESPADFIHKMKIAAKEADESEYWLLICRYSSKLKSPPKDLENDLNSIIRILSKIISSTKGNQ